MHSEIVVVSGMVDIVCTMHQCHHCGSFMMASWNQSFGIVWHQWWTAPCRASTSGNLLPLKGKWREYNLRGLNLESREDVGALCTQGQPVEPLSVWTNVGKHYRTTRTLSLTTCLSSATEFCGKDRSRCHRRCCRSLSHPEEDSRWAGFIVHAPK